MQKNLQPEKVREEVGYGHYDPNSDYFGKHYTIVNRSGLSAGANGGVEKIEAMAANGSKQVFAMKTCQPMMIFETEKLSFLGRAIEKGGLLDLSENIGWTKCTGNEKIALFNLFKEKTVILSLFKNFFVKKISSIEELEQAYSLEDIKKFRKEIFGTENGGEKRMPDMYLKMFAAFTNQVIEDMRGKGSVIGESDMLLEASIYHVLGKEGHPNVLKMICFGKNESAGPNQMGGPYLVLEFAPGGAFVDQLKNAPPQDFKHLIDYSIQLATALEFLQSKEVVHRDFKLDNVLIGADGKLKLADFGTACQLGKDAGSPGNPDAMPPESGVGSLDQSKHDCWGLGFALMQMALPRDKWVKIDQLQNLLDPIKGSYRKALCLNDSELLAKTRERILACIGEGTNGEVHQDCGLDSLFPPAERDERMNQFIHIIKSLLDPDVSRRLSAAAAKKELQRLVS
jgi:serine/threonine protein kinase